MPSAADADRADGELARIGARVQLRTSPSVGNFDSGVGEDDQVEIAPVATWVKSRMMS